MSKDPRKNKSKIGEGKLQGAGGDVIKVYSKYSELKLL